MSKRKPPIRETVSPDDAKTHLSELVERASAVEDSHPLRVPGKGCGTWMVSRSFDAPLPDDLLKEFGS